MRRCLIYLATAIAIATPSAAADFGSDVVIPIVGRGPGAFASEWRTDLVVTNADRHATVPVAINFYGNDGTEQRLDGALLPRESITLKDVLHTTFGHDAITGWVSVTSTETGAKLTARARIYNVGAVAGEYGQTLQALPRAKLSREAYLPGLNGFGGYRTNVGITNPSNTDAGVFITLFEGSGEMRGGFSTIIPARTVTQFNDIFSYFGAGPLDGATVQVTSAEGVFSWASIVRNDTGDADFISGTTVQFASDVIAPLCASPAPLHLSQRPAEGWDVAYHSGTDAVATTAVLAAKFQFLPRAVYAGAYPGFSGDTLTHAWVVMIISPLRQEFS